MPIPSPPGWEGGLIWASIPGGTCWLRPVAPMGPPWGGGICPGGMPMAPIGGIPGGMPGGIIPCCMASSGGSFL